MGPLRFVLPFVLFFQVGCMHHYRYSQASSNKETLRMGRHAGDGLGVHTRSVRSLSIHTRPVRKLIARGLNFTFPCNIIGPRFDPFMNPIVWYKVVGNSEIQMNTGALMNDPFLATTRYTITPKRHSEPEATVEFPLTVTGLTLAETGTYRCELRSVKSVLANITHSLTVLAPVDTLSFISNKTHVHRSNTSEQTTFEFDELSPAFVTCQSKGGNPQPTLRIFHGKVDITRQFTLSVDRELKGPEGLEHTEYTITLTNPEFRAPISYRGETLRCLAKIHKGPSLKRQATATIEVRYPPRFDCESEQTAWVGDQDIVLSCTISANPAVDLASVTWSWEQQLVNDTSQRVNLTSGQSSDGDYANSTVDTSGRVSTTLTVANVTAEHFRKYTISASNDVNTQHFSINLREGYTTVAPTTTETTTEAETTPPPKDTIHPDKDMEKAVVATGTGASASTWNLATILCLLSLVWFGAGATTDL